MMIGVRMEAETMMLRRRRRKSSGPRPPSSFLTPSILPRRERGWLFLFRSSSHSLADDIMMLPASFSVKKRRLAFCSGANFSTTDARAFPELLLGIVQLHG